MTVNGMNISSIMISGTGLANGAMDLFLVRDYHRTHGQKLYLYIPHRNTKMAMIYPP